MHELISFLYSLHHVYSSQNYLLLLYTWVSV